MQLTSLGFVFFWLPLAAGVYFCVSKRVRPAALLMLSAGLYVLMAPSTAPGLLLSLGLDGVCLWGIGWAAARGRRQSAAFLFAVAAGKDLALMASFGIVLPFWRGTPAPIGLMSLSLSGLYALSEQRRGRFADGSAIEWAARALFFGRLPYGPAARPSAPTLARSSNPTTVLRGLMKLILGVAKRVVLAEQIFALVKTLARLPEGQLSILSAWLAAFCSALGIYYALSAYSDIAVGLGGIFGLHLPKMVYYPFQAKSIRESLYRLNMPLEELLGAILFDPFDREKADAHAYVISAIAPLVLAVWLQPCAGFLLWGLWMAGLCALDWLVLRKIPFHIPFLSRIVTFLLTLPAYVLLLPAKLSQNGGVLLALVGLGGVPLYNDAVLYLIFSNPVLLLIAAFACLNLSDRFGKLIFAQFPRLWWVFSGIFHLVLLVVTTSFLLWNVR